MYARFGVVATDFKSVARRVKSTTSCAHWGESTMEWK